MKACRRDGREAGRWLDGGWRLCAVVGPLAVLLAVIWAAPGRAGSSSLSDRQRLGFVGTSSNWQETFGVGQLRAGWYVDITYPLCDPAPEGMERARVIHVATGYTVNPSQLGPHVDKHPGTMWLIGNEPDCIWQDDVLPEEYARIYHDLYSFLKGRDPTSQVSPGGVVQPTPARLEWLNRVLAAYQSQYGETMPVDIWNIHNAILNEVGESWGAGVPPGIDPALGITRTIQDNDNMAIFTAQIWTFRQWMAEHGYGGSPLIVTEYGILMPDDYGFDPTRVNAFMSNTFDFFFSATDTELGDPNDGYRLVQRWAWYSLDDRPWDGYSGFNGNLFDPQTRAITAHGQHYASYGSAFPPLQYVDLRPGKLTATASELVEPGQTLTRTLLVESKNEGTVDSGSFTLTLTLLDEPGSGEMVQAVDNVPPASSQWSSFTLASLEPGCHDVSIWIDPGNVVDESVECNNRATRVVLAPTDRQSLPVIFRSAGGAASAAERAGVDGSRRADVPPGFQEFEVPTANSYPGQITLDGQDRVWITERDGNKVARFDPQTEQWEECEITTPDSKPWGLALDGEGNVWFAETEADQIGKLVLSGCAFSEYTATVDSQPWDVVVSGGAVWFTERQGNRIGKLAPATGVVTEYTLERANSEPAGIAAFGNYVWFTLSAVNRLGRLKTLDNSIVETPVIPTPNSGPEDILVDPGGAPWLTERMGNKVAKWTPATQGAFSEIEAPTANSQPYGIAMAQDRLVWWFTEYAGNKLGRFDTGWSPIEYSLPTPNSQPTGIAVDSNGCAWYTAPGANRIGRLCPAARYFVYVPLIRREYLDR